MSRKWIVIPGIMIIIMAILLGYMLKDTVQQTGGIPVQPVQDSETCNAIVFRDSLITSDASQYDQENAQLSLTISDTGTVLAKLDIKSLEKLEFQLELLPSRNELYIDKAIIGAPALIPDGYELLSFRIEESADNLTLMEENAHLDGQMVLHFGIRYLASNAIYYIQTPIQKFSFTELLEESKDNLNEWNLTDQELIQLEANYLMLKSETDTAASSTNSSSDSQTW